MKEPYIIGIAGGSASGKTSVCNAMIDRVGVRWVANISTDSFYKILTPEESHEANKNNYNFDHPTAFDMDLLLETLQKLKAGRSVELPIYDFATHGRTAKTKYVYGADVIVLEGIFALYDDRIRALMDLKIFVETDDDVRLARRLKRDIIERGRNITGVLQQYEKFVKPAYDDYIYPTKRYADVIVPRGVDNEVAIGLLSTHIHTQLVKRGWDESQSITPKQMNLDLIENLRILDQNNEVKYICTVLRSNETTREFFTFQSDRLVRQLFEAAIEYTPFENKTITTDTGEHYHGKSFYKKICAIAIMRSGDAMIKPVRSVIKDIETGSILIKENKEEGPKLFWVSIPKDLQDYYVFLLDPTVGSGNTTVMAIRTLMDHGVLEDHIIFITILASSEGICLVSQLHPTVRIVCAQIDDEFNQHEGVILPGLGRFGDRYFGTEEF